MAVQLRAVHEGEGEKVNSLSPPRLALVTWTALCGLGLGGCAATHGPEAEPSAIAEQEKVDPWEDTNRKVFAFNEALDIHALEPVAREWDKIIPNQVQEWLTNFRSNLHYPVVFINDLFQGKVKVAAVETGRFLVNTTLGFGGLFDPATSWGLPRREQDFGLTLGRWGVDSGRFVVIPLLGPSTLRDFSGGVVDAGLGAVSLGPLTAGWFVTAPLRAVQLINTRAAYLDIVDENRRAALDYYSFVRDAYLQHRESQLTEGGTPARSGNDLYDPDTERDSP
jgi:phospholipid-binding lipoprotein MlaA